MWNNKNEVSQKHINWIFKQNIFFNNVMFYQVLVLFIFENFLHSLLVFFEVEFLSDKFWIKKFAIEFHEYMLLVLILKRSYFWLWKVVMLRSSFTDFTSMQISWNYKPIIEYRRHLSIDLFIDKKYILRWFRSQNLKYCF